jgi:hypothetical protein
VPGRVSADSGGCRCQPALGPVSDCSENWFECATARGEAIAHADRWPWIHETLDKALGLQLSKPLREDAVAYARNAGEKLIESSRRRNQGFYDRPGPTLTDQLNCTLKGRAVVEAPTDHGE